MSSVKRNPFIQGFKEPTLNKNSHMILADVRGDGQGKLVIWSEEQSQLIVYKGCNRQIQKPCKLKHVSGIIQYQDQEKNPQAVIALSSENAFYIFRGMSESFRLKVPDIFAEPEQQILWSQYENQPQKLSAALLELNKNSLSQSAKYFLGSTTIQRKKQIIAKVFQEGINEKDAISAMTVLKPSQMNGVGNIVLGTELNRLYILDSYGHSILNQRIIAYAPSILLAFGSYHDKYMIICIGRQGQISLFLQHDKDQPSEKIKSNVRIVTAALSFPDFVTIAADQVITHFIISNSNFKLITKKYSMKFGSQPIKVEFLKVKGQKLTIVAFQNEFRLYNEKELNYTYHTDFKLYNVIFGSFSREQCCLILLYENNGFQVLILHRTFNIRENYGSNKTIQTEIENIPIPKKTSHFLQYWNDQTDQQISYKLYEKSVKLLKWRILREQFIQKAQKTEGRLQVNSKILGLGPTFHIQLQIQNLSSEIIFNVNVMLLYNRQNLKIVSSIREIGMLAPMSPYTQQIEVVSLSYKNQQLTLELSWEDSISSSIIFIPNCEEFANQ